jgi:hypothetical protein
MTEPATSAEVIAVLRSECARCGGQGIWAREHKFSPQYVSEVLSGRKDVSEAMANALGYFRQVRFLAMKTEGVG